MFGKHSLESIAEEQDVYNKNIVVESMGEAKSPAKNSLDYEQSEGSDVSEAGDKVENIPKEHVKVL